MNDQMQIVVRSTDDQTSNQVLVVAAVLALEWAAPYANITIGQHGEVIVDPKIEAIGGLLRLSPERTERLRASGRDAIHGDDTEIHILENDEGSWGVHGELNTWWATGLALAASSFTARTPVGHALAETLSITRRDDNRAVELLEESQHWALTQIDAAISTFAKNNPRRLGNLLLSATTEVEAVAEAHALLRSRYQADIEKIGRDT